MRQFRLGLLIVIICAILGNATETVASKKTEHVWLTGKILDEDQVSHYVGTYHNSSTNASVNGSWNDTGYGGSYSGNGSSSTSSMSMPIYHVYENLVVEGDGMIFITSERLRWRWSKGARVTVNETIQYYVDGRKLHILDQDGKEHSIQINKAIRRVENSASTDERPAHTPNANASVPVQVDSTPSGADIEVDGAFVGNTPSTVNVTPGEHDFTLSKKGFAAWTRKLTTKGNTAHIAAELEGSISTASPSSTNTEPTPPSQRPQ